jgi:hypothetical protein
MRGMFSPDSVELQATCGFTSTCGREENDSSLVSVLSLGRQGQPRNAPLREYLFGGIAVDEPCPRQFDEGSTYFLFA